MAADLLDYLRGMGGPERDIEIGIQTIHSYTTLVSEMGMEVLIAPMDPALSQALDEQEYRRILGACGPDNGWGKSRLPPRSDRGIPLQPRKPADLLYAAVGMLATVGFAPSVVTLVVLSNQAIHAGASGYGALQATTTVGLAVGAALGGRLAQRFPRVTVMALGYIAMGAGTLLLGLAPSLAFGVLWVAIRSACNGVLSVAGVSVIQQRAPNQYRGRVLHSSALPTRFRDSSCFRSREG